MILLDTHVLVWIDSGRRISSEAYFALISAREWLGIYISPVTIYEVGVLAARGSIAIRLPLENWVEDITSLPGTNLTAITSAIALDAARLPEPIHRDPLDRLLIATARENNLTLLTRDRQILDYADAGHVSAIAA